MSRAPDLVGLDWIRDGRRDIGRWAAHGLGIHLHDRQLAVAEALLSGDAVYHFLWWANRAGKTTLLIVLHLWHIFYRIGQPQPRTETEYEQFWLSEQYRTLHTAPLNELALRAWQAAGDIIAGTSRAQRDPETGERRPAPLGAFFAAVSETDRFGQPRPVIRCLSGGVTDFRSTEGGGGRIEGGAWHFITWDEWPQQERIEDVRTVLTRLTNRAADHEAKILITGTITEETEHIAKEWISLCEDPGTPDWWGIGAPRFVNPMTSRRYTDVAARTMSAEDYARTVEGRPGGVKGRAIPSRLLDGLFDPALPRFSPPPTGEEERRRWTYVHAWDLAIAAASNVGIVLRAPADWRFGVRPDGTFEPLVGVHMKVVPGSSSLTTAEIVHVIEETYLPYGGTIVVDATDAFGKGIARSLRAAGYPVESFAFNERAAPRLPIRKDQALERTRELLSEGARIMRGPDGEPLTDDEGLVRIDWDSGFGAVRVPLGWTLLRDQLAALRPDDERQRKDAAMAFLMACDVAWRRRRGQTMRARPVQPLVVFGRG